MTMIAVFFFNILADLAYFFKVSIFLLLIDEKEKHFMVYFMYGLFRLS